MCATIAWPVLLTSVTALPWASGKLPLLKYKGNITTNQNRKIISWVYWRKAIELKLQWTTTCLPHGWLSSFGRSVSFYTASSFVSRILGFSSHHAKVIHDWPMASSGKLASHCVISSCQANKDMTGWSKVSPDQKLRTQGSWAQLYAVWL